MEQGKSNKSLSQKLGLKPGMNAIVFNAPSGYKSWLGTESSIVKSKSNPPWDFVHLFVNHLIELEERLYELRSQIHQDGIVWISWYKKSSKKPSEISEDLIRDTCLPLGFVDVKVCSVTDEWSGLKLVIRKKNRTILATDS